MKNIILGFAVITLLFACNVQNSISTDKVVQETKIALPEVKKPEMKPPMVKQYTIEQFMDNEAVRGGSFSPDNSNLLVSSNRTGIFNI